MRLAKRPNAGKQQRTNIRMNNLLGSPYTICFMGIIPE